jgi:hypothetical protein
MYIAWSIFTGVSVPEMPKTWKLRIFFLIYVCYCFAISTVFQAFYTSFLVEPGYGKKIETVDDLLESNVDYGFNDAMQFGLGSMSYEEQNSFPSSRRQDCNHLEECTKRIANNDQLCTISATHVTQYIAGEIGIREFSKCLCTLKDNLFTTGFVFLLNNGSPFLNRLNVLTRRSQEGRLLDRYWAQLIWITSLRSKMTVGDGEDKMYFVFSLSHLSPAFCALGFGYVLSSAVFLVEIFVKWIAKGRK